MIDDEVLMAIAEAYRTHRTARREAKAWERNLQELVGDFITRTHTVDDLVKLMDMVAWRVEEEEER